MLATAPKFLSKAPKLLLAGAKPRWHSTNAKFPAARSVYPDEEIDFDPETPLILRGRFGETPAISKWFTRTTAIPEPGQCGCKQNPPTLELNIEYLQKHGETHAPLELTRREGAQTSFQRFSAPISLLLAHMTQQNPQDESMRLYLAQYSLADLPPELRDDLPTPGLISEFGAGDIYGSSLWMGLPPTRTPLHRDPNPNLFVQLAGTKKIRLMRPERGRVLYERTRVGTGHANMRGDEMMVGKENDKLEDVVWNDSSVEKGVEGVEAELHSGDGLYIPLGWWHAVKGVKTGANVSVNWWFR